MMMIIIIIRFVERRWKRSRSGGVA